MSLIDRVTNVVTRRIPVKCVRERLDGPVASFSFDDFPRSAWTVGGPILERYGAKATYYPAGVFCGAHEDGMDYFTAEDLVACARAGHEIGCHTFGHRHGSKVSSADLVAEIEQNAAFLARHLGDMPPSSFAYPYGEVTPRTKRLLARLFPVSRGIYPGVNAGTVDLAQLKAIPLEQRSWRAADVERYVAEAVEQTGWIVFFSHDVAAQPSPYGATPEMLEHALDTATRAGLDILPVKHALARAAFG
jgi:peptidoglycan/xylan/chitin deacetylase (PgdA/CDA1 family)